MIYVEHYFSFIGRLGLLTTLHNFLGSFHILINGLILRFVLVSLLSTFYNFG